MKLSNIKNVGKFFDVIDSCKGRVELVTDEGDHINLKSKLSQYISLANIFSDGQINDLELMTSDPDDTKRIMWFMINAGRYMQFICDNGQLLYVNVDTGVKKSQIDGDGRIISSFNVVHR